MKKGNERRNWTETSPYCGKGDQEMKQMVLKGIDESGSSIKCNVFGKHFLKLHALELSVKLSISTTTIWHRHKYVSGYIRSLKRKLLEVHPYLIITMEPVLYIPAGTWQLELVMYISGFSSSWGAIWKRDPVFRVLQCVSQLYIIFEKIWES